MIVDTATPLPRPRGRRRLGRNTVIFLLLAPIMLVMVVFFVIPMVAVFTNSISLAGTPEREFSLANYWSIITDDFYWEIMIRTTWISVLTTLGALLLGYPAALYVYFSESNWRRVLLLIVVSPLFISLVVRTYGWMVIFSPNGLIDALMPAGTAPRLMNTETAIIIGLVHIYVPFMVLALNASLTKVDRRLMVAAGTLGASSWRAFRDVLFPLSLPGVQAGCLVVFASAMTAFATPMLLGGSANKTMAYMIYQQNLLLGNWNMGGAVAFVLLALTLAIVFIINRVLDRRDLREAAA